MQNNKQIFQEIKDNFNPNIWELKDNALHMKNDTIEIDIRPFFTKEIFATIIYNYEVLTYSTKDRELYKWLKTI